jgi:hypothetical protein
MRLAHVVAPHVRTDADLTDADLTDARAVDLLGCPLVLPAGTQCLLQPALGLYAPPACLGRIHRSRRLR